jgi:hypothetical protein
MKVWNKKQTTKSQLKVIRNQFCRKIEMYKIIKSTGFTERVIRRIVKENNWIKLRKRYLLYLCKLAYARQESITAIAKQSGVKDTILHRVKRNNDINTQRFNPYNKIRNDKIDKKVLDMYQSGKGSVEISKITGFATHKSVLDILSDHNIKKRSTANKTNYVIDFFSNINSVKKAYFLGWMYSDGYILKDYGGFGLSLQRRDRSIVEMFSSFLGDSANVKDYDRVDKITGRKRHISRVHVFNKKMAIDLKQLGVVRNKTRIMRLTSKLPCRLFNHFVRGCIDGDGCIGIYGKHKYPAVNLVSASEIFVDELQSKIINLGFDIRKRDVTALKYKDKFFKLEVCGGRKLIYSFLKWLYKGHNGMLLRRKYEKVQSYIN